MTLQITAVSTHLVTPSWAQTLKENHW